MSSANNSNKKSVFQKLTSALSSSISPQKLSKMSFQLENLSVDDLEKYNILMQYHVNEAQVNIVTDARGKMYYLIVEPTLGPRGKVVFTKIMRFLYVSLPSEIKSKSVRTFIKERIIEISNKLKIDHVTYPIIDVLVYYAMRDSLGYGIIDVLMNDPNLEDIVQESFIKPVGVVHRKFGDHGILDTNISFKSGEAVNVFVQKLVQRTGKSMTAAVPYIDSITKEGHRIAATFGKEVSLPGSNFTIRKFSEKPFTISALLEMGTISPLMAAYVWILLESKSFILVIGSTAAGKTTTIGALSSMLNPQAKIITIEDTPELRIDHTHWQRLITRKGTSMYSEKYEVSMDDLVRLSLRSRPDYIVVGEVRGEEVSSLIQAVSTGHGGLTSFHASDAKSTLVRMESPPMNVHLSGQMLISTILNQTRLVGPDGKISRKITGITEIRPQQNSIELKKVLEWDPMLQKFSPDNVEDLLKRSEKLAEIRIVHGWTKEELINQIVIRMAYLQKMVKDGVKDFEEVTKELERFYYDPLSRYMVLVDTKKL